MADEIMPIEKSFEDYKKDVEAKLQSLETLIKGYASKEELQKINVVLTNFQNDIVELKASGAGSKEFEKRFDILQDEVRTIGGDILKRFPESRQTQNVPEKKSPVLILDW